MSDQFAQPAAATTPRPPRPTVVTAAFWLLIASAVVAVISAIVSALTLSSPESRAELRRVLESELAGQDTGGLSLDSLVDVSVTTAIAGVVIIAAISAIITVVLAFLIKRGNRVGRILVTVFAALKLISFFLAIDAIGGVSLLLYVVAAVLVWLPAAAPYFAKRRR